MNNSDWNVSNLLSASRFVIAIPLSLALYNGWTWWILGLTLLASATDFLDGYFARKYNEVSELGKIIDPVADKVLVGASAVALFASGKIEWWFLSAIMLRDLLILAGGIFVRRRHGVTMMSNWIGKYTVGLVALALMLIAMGVESVHSWFIGVSMALLAFSLLVYAVAFVRVLNSRS